MNGAAGGPWKRFFGGFVFAARGVLWGIRSQRNLRVHAAAAVAVVALGAWQGVAAWEWCALALAIGLVMGAELLNSALEVLCDRVTGERDEAIRIAKDAAAGGVLLAALAAAAVGAVVFVPRWS
ncbi:MAG: diacylglycerol kinase family protein [Planctomycetaceae bacterium]|nr:diacylglycerol kinase family protein [Planctomycetaceae bacterium]